MSIIGSPERAFHIICHTIEQCFSTGGPQRSFSHFVSNRNFIHNYKFFYKKPTLLLYKHQKRQNKSMHNSDLMSLQKRETFDKA